MSEAMGKKGVKGAYSRPEPVSPINIILFFKSMFKFPKK